MGKDAWGILLADVAALVAESCWVVDGEEESAQVFVGDLGGVETDLDDLDMA